MTFFRAFPILAPVKKPLQQALGWVAGYVGANVQFYGGALSLPVVVPAALPAEVEELLAARAAARAAKDWPRSDALRARLQTLGYLVKDTPKGQVATPVQ